MVADSISSRYFRGMVGQQPTKLIVNEAEGFMALYGLTVNKAEEFMLISGIAIFTPDTPLITRPP